MSAVTVPWAPSRDERRVVSTLRALPWQHRAALRGYMNREHVERRDLEAAIDAFRKEWNA